MIRRMTLICSLLASLAPAQEPSAAPAEAQAPADTASARSDGASTAANADSTFGLEKVRIKGRRASRSEYVAKMAMDRIENPQVYNTVDAKTMKEQVVSRYDEALRNVPGLDKLWEPTGRAYGDGAAYYTMRGFDAQPNHTNGMPGLTLGSLDPANVERIEVLKGPSGTLFGSSDVTYGGMINNVTKQPGQERFGEAALTVGSFGLTRLTADANMPLDPGKNTALRIITAAHSEGSFQDAGFRKSFFLAPSLVYQATDRVSLLLNAEYMAQETTNPVMLFLNRSRPVDWANLKELNYDPKLSLTSNDLSIHNPTLNLQARMDYRLAPGWTSQSIVSRGSAQSEGYYSYLWNEDPKTFGLWISDEHGEITTTDVQQNFVGDFNVGSFRNRLLLGADWLQRVNVDNSSGQAWVHNVDGQGNISYLEPYTGGDTVAPRPLTRQTVDSLLASQTPSHSNVLNRVYSGYASEVLNVLPSLSASATLRVDYFDTEGDIATDDDDYHQLALSPKFGLVYQPIQDKLALFGSYLDGFRNVAPAKVSDADGSNPRSKTFKPEHADQWEAGVKTDLFGNRLSSTFSGYYIRVKDIVLADPSNPNNSLQGGEVESRGIEADVNASPVEGLNLLAGYAWNDIQVIKSAPDDIWSAPGRRPIGAGPEHMFNAWIHYTVGEGPLRGLGLGAGANAFSGLLIQNSDAIGRFLLPGTAVFNAVVSYAIRGATLSLAVNNLTDEEYYKGYSTVNPQMPRNTAANFAYKF